LSSYLPNDNFDLIGYFNLEYIASSTSVWSGCKLIDNATNYTLTLGQVLREGSFGYQRIFVWFPIPENRIITKIIEGANAERCRLFFLGYQKLNSIELV